MINENPIFPITANRISTKGMSREDWLIARRSGIGGSEAAAVVGLNKYASPLDIFNDKMGLLVERPEKLPMRLGRELEPLVADLYVERTGNDVRRQNFMKRHADLRFMISNIDRKLVGVKRGLECKTAGAYSADRFGADGSDQVPDEYLIQCMHYMIVEGFEVMDLAVLIGNHDFKVFEIPFDQGLADMVIEREGRFWNDYVLEELAPPPTADDIKGLYPVGDEDLTEIAGEAVLDAYMTLKTVNGQIKDLDARKKNLEAVIKDGMGEAAYLSDGVDTIATWKNQTSNRFDTTAFKKVHAALYAEFTRPSESRVFRLK